MPFGSRPNGFLLLVELLGEGFALVEPACEVGGAGRILGDGDEGEVLVEVGVAGVVEEGEGSVVFLVFDGVVGVGVALDAAHGDALPGFPGGGDAVHDGGDAEFLVVGAAFGVGLGVAVEIGGDEVVEGGIREEVAGELFDGELVEGEVGIVGADDPVAEGPGGARAVEAEAFGVCVAGEVEPVGGPFFAEVGGGEEAGDFLLPGGFGVGFPGGFEGVEFGKGGGEADEVEREAAEEEGGLGLGVGLEVFLFEVGEDEVVDGVFGPVLLFDGGRGSGDGSFEGPVFVPFRAFGDPLAEFGDVGLFEGRAVLWLGHDEVGIGGGDAFNKFRLVWFSWDDGWISGFADGEGFFAEDE